MDANVCIYIYTRIYIYITLLRMAYIDHIPFLERTKDAQTFSASQRLVRSI